MHQIQINDQLYLEAQRRAAAAGFGSVDDYVADILQHDVRDEAENLDYLFTPERLVLIDRAPAQIDAGQGFNREQVEIQLANRRKEWLDQNAR